MEYYSNPNLLKLTLNRSDYLAPSQVKDWPCLPVERASGSYLFTADGKKYLDFTSGIGVANVGHCHPRVIEVARIQMEKMIHGAIGITYHETLFVLCGKLKEVLPSKLDMFFFCNSGSEAIDGALKLARYVTRRPGIIAFTGGFHGRTIGCTSVTTSKSKYRQYYEPLIPGVYFAPYAYPYRCPIGSEPEKVVDWSIQGITNLFEHNIPPSDVAAILMEPVQGEGGYIIPPRDFLVKVRQLCDEHGILLIFDEVQSGFGRTGQMFASQAFDVTPDILAVAKGIASGFPLGAIIANHELMSKWTAGAHGTTFGGNPVSCAAGIATQDIIREEKLLENARIMGNKFLVGLKNFEAYYDHLGEARGIGLMLAMEIIKPGKDKTPDPEKAKKILEGCLNRGLVLYIAGKKNHVIRVIPPLIVNSEQIEQAIEIIGKSLE